MPGLTTAFAQGTHAARPAAATANTGYYYYETDTAALFQSTGSSWVQVAAASTLSTATQSANTVFSGPTSGGAVIPAFRALVAADVPSLDASKITTGNIATARLGNVTLGVDQVQGATQSPTALTKAFMATTGGTVFTDVTAAINGSSGATFNYGAVNDALYLGSTSTNAGQFSKVSLTRATAAVFTLTLVYEYWNGSAWTTFASGYNFFDGVTNFTAVNGTYTFLPPSDWATNTVNSVAAWWIRVRCSAFTSTTTSPVYKNATLLRWSDFSNTWINGPIPCHGTIIMYVPSTAVTSNAYALYNFTTNTYSVLATNPVTLPITGLSISVNSLDQYAIIRTATTSVTTDAGVAYMTLS